MTLRIDFLLYFDWKDHNEAELKTIIRKLGTKYNFKL